MVANLLIIMLNLLMLVRFRGGASGFSRPLYVALKSFQGMKMVEVSPVMFGATNSCSYEIVDCSLPVSGSRGNNSFLMLNAYRLANPPTALASKLGRQIALTYNQIWIFRVGCHHNCPRPKCCHRQLCAGWRSRHHREFRCRDCHGSGPRHPSRRCQNKTETQRQPLPPIAGLWQTHT